VAGTEPTVVRTQGRAGRRHHLRGCLVAGAGARRPPRPARNCWSISTPRPITPARAGSGWRSCDSGAAKMASHPLHQPDWRPGRTGVRRRLAWWSTRRRTDPAGSAFSPKGLYPVDFQRRRGRWTPFPAKLSRRAGPEEGDLSGLVLGVRDYVNKNGFPGVVLGLIRRHRFGADPGHCRRRAGAGPGRSGADAIALYRRYEQYRRRAGSAGPGCQVPSDADRTGVPILSGASCNRCWRAVTTGQRPRRTFAGPVPGCDC
jgi:hypothetical protein